MQEGRNRRAVTAFNNLECAVKPANDKTLDLKNIKNQK